jgi:hypothetical protein
MDSPPTPNLKAVSSENFQFVSQPSRIPASDSTPIDEFHCPILSLDAAVFIEQGVLKRPGQTLPI